MDALFGGAQTLFALSLTAFTKRYQVFLLECV